VKEGCIIPLFAFFQIRIMPKRILLTGATGYIGKRLLPALLEKGFHVICCVRDKNRIPFPPSILEKIEYIEMDFFNPTEPESLPGDIDAAYYLVHSLNSRKGNFYDYELKMAENFRKCVEKTSVKQVVYLGGIDSEKIFSKNKHSKSIVYKILSEGNYHLTTIRTGIIVGSGSATFEVIRDTVEKQPVMFTPRWVHAQTQPIAITDVVTFLAEVLFREDCFDQSYRIGGPQTLSYKDMLLQYAAVRQLKRNVLILPFINARISKFWLFLTTSVSYRNASNLVESMRFAIPYNDRRLEALLGIRPMTYKAAIRQAIMMLAQNMVISSWRDSLVSSTPNNRKVSEFIEVPHFGCYKNAKHIKIQDTEKVLEKIWSIGGEQGYYYATWLWKIRGLIDRLFGGVGLSRGRTNTEEVYSGDALDFWRVIYSSKEDRRLILFAEMKLPGEGWLEFKIDEHNILHQIATFRPKGLVGRLYWGFSYPFHLFIFRGMIRRIAMVD